LEELVVVILVAMSLLNQKCYYQSCIEKAKIREEYVGCYYIEKSL
jgi:hypothetical protein